MTSNELNILDSINLDFSNNNIKSINAKQTDTKARYINVTCTDHGKKVILNHETVGALIVCKKPDNFYVLNRCTVSEEGTILIELTQQMLAVSGKAVAELILYSGVLDNNVDISGFIVSDDGAGNVSIDGTNDIVQTLHNSGVSVLTTMSFFINILPSVLSDSKIESSHEFNALVDGLFTQFAIEQQMKALEDSITDAEELRIQAEKDRDSAESLRDRNETARQEAERIRHETETARKYTLNYEIDRWSGFCGEAVSNCEAATSECTEVTKVCKESTTYADETLIPKMEGIIEAVNGVIDDDEPKEDKTYSSQKIEDMIFSCFNNNFLKNAGFKFGTFEGGENQEEVYSGDGLSMSVYNWYIYNSSDYNVIISRNDNGELYIRYSSLMSDVELSELPTNTSVFMYQELDDSFYETYCGMDYVLTTKIDGKINIQKGKVPSIDAPENEKYFVKIEICPETHINEDEYGVYASHVDKEYTISYAKLELGTVSTLFIPRTYDEEYGIKTYKVFNNEAYYLATNVNGVFYLDIPILSMINKEYVSIYPDFYSEEDTSIEIRTSRGDYTVFNYGIANEDKVDQLILYILDPKEVYDSSSYEPVAIRFKNNWYLYVSNNYF